MLSFALKVFFWIIYSFASWLSVKKPILAGFIIALTINESDINIFSYLRA